MLYSSRNSGRSCHLPAATALRATTAIGALALAALHPAVAAPPQDQATIDSTSQPGQQIAHQGADHGGQQPDSGGGTDGGDADGWTVDLKMGAWISADHEGALVSIYSVGGNGGNGAQGGSGSSPGHAGGKGGDSGDLSFTADTPTDQGQYWAMLNQNGSADSYGLALRAIGGSGGKGETPGSNTETGGPPGAAGRGGDISFIARQNGNAPTAYNVIDTLGAATGIWLYSQGGGGGAGGDSVGEGTTKGIAGAAGAKGGDITASISLNMMNTSGMGINMTSIGGNGGDGGLGGSVWAEGKAGDGANAADGGMIYFEQLGGSISASGSGSASEIEVNIPNDPDPSHPTYAKVSLEGVNAAILGQSIGGTGGTDGGADGFEGSGGHGGKAGNGGTVSLNLRGSGIYQAGGYEPYRDAGAVSTQGDNAAGVIASSVGGTGGGTSDVGGAFSKKGGGGGQGGAGGQAYVSLLQTYSYDPSNDYTLITTNGNQSDGVIVQSVGGGGGVGGDVNGGGVVFTIQHGGNGGGGGLGGSAGIDNGYWESNGFVDGYQIHTRGTNSIGILVESIGGTGGRGGNALGAGLGVGTLVIGGNGGSGGNAADATISSFGIVQTEGDQSIGLFSQSVGGGGGAGGSTVSIDVGSVFTSSTAIGGTGGVGGDGFLSQIFNFGQVLTAGHNAIGLFSQSIGGGGGNGGSSSASVFAVNPPDVPFPTANLDLSIGGKGGAGGVGGTVNLFNTGLIATQGMQAMGVFGQSVGGGGGNGGDATAMSQSYNQANLQANVALGGDSGNGSVGGQVTVQNSGLVQTLGQGSVGVFAQSVGGGGGNGGLGSTNQGAYNDAADGWSVQSSVGIGGKGGTGGDGGTVTVRNFVDANYDFSAGNAPSTSRWGNGGITTLGLSAPGIFAQSIGGGGGNAGDGVGQGGGGKLTVNVAIGGSGGSGGDGGDVFIDNGEGAILTVSANSPGMFGQSVGGGGGNGGNATTGSGNDPKKYYPEWLANQGANAVGNGDVTLINNGFWDWRSKAVDAWNDVIKLNDLVQGYQSSNDGGAPDTESNDGQEARFKIDIGAGYGGAGGASGVGGMVELFNEGTIVTLGAGSYGMFGQSVGAGGGTGGGSTAATTNDKADSSTFAASLALGGANGSNGDGGDVYLTNGSALSPGAQILTHRDLSHAMYGLSVGGGGGVGGASKSTAAAKAPGGIAIAFGADGSSGGAGGDVQLDNGALLATIGDDAIGMLGQSIGGGGGFASITGQEFDDQGFAHSATGLITDGVTISLSNPVEHSDGGTVTMLLHETGVIHTGSADGSSGRNSYGIMAQTIGGSGGMAIVGKNPSPDICTLFTACDNQSVSPNHGGQVFVNTDWGSSIVTTGGGAAGIVAQAIGGGGITINGLYGVDILNAYDHPGVPSRGSSDAHWNAGEAGSIQMQVNGNITTTGAYAHGIFAQAAYNGGGMVGREDGGGYLMFGNANENSKAPCVGQPQCYGHITISVGDGTNATTISVSGASAAGIAAFSIGGTDKGNSVHIEIAENASILASGNAIAGLVVAAEYEAFVNNHGTIDASQSQAGVAATGWGLSYMINNYGIIRGSVINGAIDNEEHPAQPTVVNNFAGGLLEAGSRIELGSGTLTNDGTLDIGGLGKIGVTAMTGQLNQTAHGRLHIDTDLANDKADRLVINGGALVAGTVHVNPTSISNRSVKVLTASEGLTLDPAIAMTDSSHLYDFRTSVAGNDMSVKAVANFSARAASFGNNEQSVAGNLQALFDKGATADKAFTRLLSVSDDSSYRSALGAISGKALGSFGAFRFNSSRTFAANLYGGCPEMELAGKTADRCGWARMLVNTSTQDASADRLGYKADATAMQIGGQVPLNDKLALTGSLAYESSKFHDGDARIKGDAIIGGLGLSYAPERIELSVGIDMAYGWYRSRRIIGLAGLSEEVTARPEQSQIGGHVRAAYNLLDGGSMFVRPFMEGHAIHVSNKAFTEDGTSPFRLAVEKQSDTALIGVAGLELGTSLPLSTNVTLRPFASAAIEFGNSRDWTTTARFAEQPQSDSFDLKTAGPGTLGRFSVGADLLGSKNVAFSLQYAPEVGKDYISHAGMARLTIAF